LQLLPKPLLDIGLRHHRPVLQLRRLSGMLAVALEVGAPHLEGVAEPVGRLVETKEV